MSVPILQPTRPMRPVIEPVHTCQPVPAVDAMTAPSHATAAVSVWTATGHERPVFLDERGRRRHWVALAGTLTAAAAALWLGGLVAGGVGFSGLPSWRALPSVAAATSKSITPTNRVEAASSERRTDAVAVLTRENRAPNRVRRGDLTVRWRTGAPVSRRVHPLLLATVKLD